MSAGTRPDRIPSLDGVRAVAIALVIASHFAYTTAAPGWFASASEAMHLGALGVRVFFVLSGFLITRLLVDEHRARGTISLRRFYLRRTLRIFPAYYAYLAVVFGAAAVGWLYVPASAALHAVTYTTDYARLTAWATGHGWSLSVEEQFYLLWPAAIALLGTRRSAALAAACIVVAPLVRLAYHVGAPDLLRPEFRFECVVDSLATGCLLALGRERLWESSTYRRLVESRAAALLPIALLALASLDRHPLVGMPIGIPLQNVAIAVMLDASARRPESIAGRALNTRAAVYIGTLSYSLYLWQQPFFDPAAPRWMTAAPWNLAYVAAAALASYYLVERPALRWRAHLARRRDATLPAPSAQVVEA